MNESEFRDWTRAQLRTLDERIRAAAAKAANPDLPAIPVEGRISGEMAMLAEGLRKRVMEKQIAGLAIAFVTVEGNVLSGFAAADGTYFQLAGAANFVGLEVLEGFRQTEKAAEKAEAEAKREEAKHDQPA
jgi:hypothetical protein